MKLDTESDAKAFLKRIGKAQDCEIDLCHSALAFSCLYKSNYDVAPYLTHIEEISNELSVAHRRALDNGDEDTASLCHETISHVLYDTFEYRGDDEDYNALDNAHLQGVIDRKKGLPVALGIIYMHVARDQGWEVVGLNFPGHFVIRLTHKGVALLIDPFREGAIMEASDLRNILKALAGQAAELSHNYYEPVSDHEIIVRLQNNLKTRLIDLEKYQDALNVVEHTKLFVPYEYRLLFDSAMLKVKTGQIRSAQDDVLDYIDLADPAEKQIGEQLLSEIRRQMN